MKREVDIEHKTGNFLKFLLMRRSWVEGHIAITVLKKIVYLFTKIEFVSDIGNKNAYKAISL